LVKRQLRFEGKWACISARVYFDDGVRWLARDSWEQS
jgi:hypothetical protein